MQGLPKDRKMGVVQLVCVGGPAGGGGHRQPGVMGLGRVGLGAHVAAVAHGDLDLGEGQAEVRAEDCGLVVAGHGAAGQPRPALSPSGPPLPAGQR